MRIVVDHRTQYRYSEPQARVVQMLRLTPCDTQDQTVVSWLIGVDCDARLRDTTDGFGNAVTMLYAEGPLEELDIAVTGEVLTLESSGMVRGSYEPLPPLFFCRSTPATLPDAAIADFAADVSGGDGLDRMHRLNAALHAHFPETAIRRDRGRSAADSFTSGKPTTREAAKIFIAAARSLAVPARYVSGYRSQEALQCAPHGWAEAHVEGLGWIGFDPSTGLCPDERYVRMAIGLDATSAAPTSGRRLGSGEEELDVDVQVQESDGQG